MSSTEKSYPALLELTGPFENVLSMDESLRNTPFGGGFDVTIPGQPPSTVDVLHLIVGKTPSHMYQFDVTKQEFEALPGQPVTRYNLSVNSETSEAVLFVVRRLVAEGISEDMARFYDEVHNAGMNLPNEADLEEFGHVFGQFCTHLAQQDQDL